MGIINVTPDSFYDGGRIKDDRTLLSAAERMLGEGADFLDIGGFSSRPGAAEVPLAEEERRVLPAIESVLKHFPESVLSVDTSRAAVAAAAIAAGAAFVNDISAGDDDPRILSVVAASQVPYVAMHKQGRPKTMQDNPAYRDVVAEVFDYLSAKASALRALGVSGVILDPGFGFGKTMEHNYRLLAHLKRFKEIGAPLLVGLSRKSMIQKALGVSAEDSLDGTIAATAVALMNGADIVRVHDVKPARDAIAVFAQIKKATK